MPTGRLKFYDGSKGFGFIIPDEKGPDAFVSKNELEAVDIKKLKPLQRLSYEMGRHPITDRPVATKIRLVEQEQQPAERFRTTALADREWPDNQELPR